MSRLLDVASAVRALDPMALARSAARLPLEMQARALLERLTPMELAELTGPVTLPISVGELDGRHAWSLGIAEQFVLQCVVRTRNVRAAFEIGTFNGGTTRVIAEAMEEGGRVTTLDLPPPSFDATQSPRDFSGFDVGRVYAASPAAHRIEQLLGDSLEFEPGDRRASYDLVLVDGAHDLEHGLADTKTALALLAPGGVILWDDFEPYWHGLIRGITTGMAGRDLRRLAGTSFGVFVHSPLYGPAIRGSTGSPTSAHYPQP